MSPDEQQTHFGFQTVPIQEKQGKVAEVFHSVAHQYDLMNDLMSFGIHRWWKRFAVELSRAKKGQCVLDLAGGSGDLARLLAHAVGPSGQVVLADINASMLARGRDRLIDSGLVQSVHYVQANAEFLPFSDNHFDCITMGFGLRNVTDKSAALRSMYQVCRPGGKIMILEFSAPVLPGLQPIYDWYSFHVLPKIGQWVAQDEDSYRYLAESIRMHPTQEELKTMIEAVGFSDCRYHNLSGGIVALHIAYKY
ncbi:MAG: bifunctional demethylmenaquinone methyltransferase/2-methoxy-6-polyprenyl-1,4-benzoquinol methylase UbiE [Legionellaceae bacterium]|nr:bifunctional demethylmenaquinone methyltransferase/2-methoxy-6-polyprenyl-1,4-benzoquinol methylase UbiE [Legionellaceae bacterium]MBP9775154.1 bifunctional demethylmenaquinone methyltransferase/2-methoxy-6-polyprenyl-1,4-benzoquinol methylase UbiE [Legionellaceae bacterium]